MNCWEVEEKEEGFRDINEKFDVFPGYDVGGKQRYGSD